MVKVAITTNIPAPYRVDFFEYLNQHDKNYRFYIIYAKHSEENRKWNVKEEQLTNSYFLKSKTITIRGNHDDRFIHVPFGLFDILNSIKPDYVIASEYNILAIQSLVWCKLKKIPFFNLTDGTLTSEKNIGWLQKKIRKIIIGNAQGYIASSTKAKEKLLYWNAPKDKIVISFLTEDSKAFKSIKREPVPGRILYVGSFIKRKGLDLLFYALSKVKEPYEMILVGNGTNEQIMTLTKLAEKLKIQNRIRWVGYKEGMALVEEYAKANLFVLPTREDCFGLVLLEAAFTGVPIVSSIYADAAYDIITENNGCLIDPYNDEEFARSISLWLHKTSTESVYEKFSFYNAAKALISTLVNDEQ